MDASNVLSLDLGRKMGWAMLTAEQELSGTHELYKSGDRKSYDDGELFMRLHAKLSELAERAGKLDIVTFEQVSGGTKGRQTTLYNGYRAVVMHWCAIRGVPCVPLPVSTIKLCTSGSGAGKKEGVYTAIKSFGYDPQDDNEADAIAALLTLSKLNHDKNSVVIHHETRGTKRRGRSCSEQKSRSERGVKTTRRTGSARGPSKGHGRSRIATNISLAKGVIITNIEIGTSSALAPTTKTTKRA